MNMLNSAKKFAMKNKDKIAKGVDKATDAIDKKTGGKHTDKLRKLDAAAAKFAGKPGDETVASEAQPSQPVTSHPVTPEPASSSPVHPEPPTPEQNP